MLNFTIIFSKVASIFSLTTNDYKNSIKLYKMQTNGDCDIMVDCASESIHFGQSSLLTAVYHLRITDYTYRRNFIHFDGNFLSFFKKFQYFLFNFYCLFLSISCFSNLNTKTLPYVTSIDNFRIRNSRDYCDFCEIIISSHNCAPSV